MFIVYSKPACSYCEQAKSLLESRGEDFRVVNLDVGQTKVPSEEYISKSDFLSLIPTARTVPQIVMRTGAEVKHIGGFQELRTHLNA